MRLTALFVVAKALQTDFAGRADHLSRRRALLTISSSTLVLPSAAFAADGGFSQADAQAARAFAGDARRAQDRHGRSLNALIKMRSETGIERTGVSERARRARAAARRGVHRDAPARVDRLSRSPRRGASTAGPNMDVRNVQGVRLGVPARHALPAAVGGSAWSASPTTSFSTCCSTPAGKYGAYGKVEDRKVLSSSVQLINLLSGGTQLYRRIALKFAPPTYNGAAGEGARAPRDGRRRHGFHHGGRLTSATRYKKMEPELLAIRSRFERKDPRLGGVSGCVSFLAPSVRRHARARAPFEVPG